MMTGFWPLPILRLRKDDAFIVSFTVETDEGMLEIEEVLGEDV